MSTPNEPTPWTDERGYDMYDGSPDKHGVVTTDDCRTLERHLRRIVEAKSRLDQAEQVLELVPHGNPTHDDMWAAVSELDAAIQAAKEELSK